MSHLFISARAAAGLTAFLAVVLIHSMATGQMRTWVNSTGEHRIKAEMTSVDTESVNLVTADGKELTIPLEKLSKADQAFIEKLGSATYADEQAMQQIAIEFYSAINDDPDKIRDFLTDDGQAKFDKQRSFFKMGSADSGQKPRVTKISFDDDGQRATANFRVRMDGDFKKMQMLFTRAEDQWRVNGLVGISSTARLIMDFEQAKWITEPLR